MVSDDSTSRVMVFPVTASVLANVQARLIPGGEEQAGGERGSQLTGLDEDLHVCGGVWICDMCLLLCLMMLWT